MTALACDACLRRSWLVARLAAAIDVARHEKRGVREILALSDERLIAALAPATSGDIAAELEALEPDAIRAAADEARLAAVCRHDGAYPARLRDLADAPAALFLAAADDAVGRLGRLVGGSLDDGPAAVAIVGTRRASAEGHEVARGLARGVATAGVGVVSGMALGVDSAAHAGALDGGGGTVAVLAGCAERPYPPSKRRLYERIAELGCIVSEMPPRFTPFKWCFPARNRIIAALGHMTVVVEAAERSGSLITAEVAADLGREIGAVPGPVTSWRARGTNGLLRDGATLVRNARDVLDAVVGVDQIGGLDPATGLEPRLESILRAVGDGRDTLAALAGTPDQAQRTLAALTELELLGRLRRVAGGRYVVVAPW
jgi:DNA processing protein